MAKKTKMFQCISAMFDPSLATTCDLYKQCKSPYMAVSGDLDAEVLFIGEAPGAEEDVAGVQFIGESGKLLRSALKRAGVLKYATTNAIRCRPPGNRDPKTVELKTCRPFIDEDIAQMPNLKLLVLVGNHAMQTMLGHKGILESSGTYSQLEIDGRKFGVLCLMHPSYVLQNQTELNRFIDHVSRIPNAITGSLVDTTDEGVYTYVVDVPTWSGLVQRIERQTYFIYDLETNSLDPYPNDSKITCISISLNPREAFAMQPQPWMMHDLERIMTNPNIKKIGHNIKFDNLWMYVKYNIEVKGTAWDTEIGQYLLDENESHGLKSLAWKHSKLGGYEQRLVQGQPHLHEDTNLMHYSCIDSDLTNRIFSHQQPILMKDAGLVKVMNTLMLPVTEVLMHMENRGIRIDPVKLLDCKVKVVAELDRLVKDMGSERSVKKLEAMEQLTFNPRSTVQLRKVLFDFEGLASLKSTEKAKLASTDRSVLEFYRDSNRLCDLLCDYSLYQSMRSKMIKELEEHNIGGRIHTHYWLFETATGRSSSESPNLQNVTKGKKDVVGIRDVFVADDGFDLLECDYNQHELRCMAEIAEDDVLYNAVKTGDVHRATAAALLNKDPKLITEDERRDKGKTFNFGLIYGLTKFGIMRRLKCSDRQAQDYLDKFFGTYQKTKVYMDATTWFVKQNGYVKSKLGRYRRFPIYNELDDKCVREAINMPVQSLAGDILLYSLIGIHELLQRKKARSYLCLEIHDSLMLNLHKEEHDLLPQIQHIMLNYFRKYVPFNYDLAVDMKMGPSWGKMNELKI